MRCEMRCSRLVADENRESFVLTLLRAATRRNGSWHIGQREPFKQYRELRGRHLRVADIRS
jgi:hypothetical protein